MEKEIKPLSETAKNFKFGVYQHFKGNNYKVLNIGRDSDTLEEVVIYQGLYDDNPVFVRPLNEFIETIERDGERIERFKYISDQ